jgi:hypothetical protein
MKQSDLDSMSIDGLFRLHEGITATLAAKITAEKEALINRLKQADLTVHERVRDLRRSISHDAATTGQRRRRDDRTLRRGRVVVLRPLFDVLVDESRPSRIFRIFMVPGVPVTEQQMPAHVDESKFQ